MRQLSVLTCKGHEFHLFKCGDHSYSIFVLPEGGHFIEIYSGDGTREEFEEIMRSHCELMKIFTAGTVDTLKHWVHE